jgi:hypothetical protein
VPLGAGWTRREQSSSVASPEAPGLAALADRHVFGPAQPPEAAAASYWAAVDAERHRLSREPRLRRLRAALSLRTFRRR